MKSELFRLRPAAWAAIVLGAASLLAAVPAAAQKLRRAEEGSVSLLADPLATMPAGEFRSGQLVWTEALRPALNVRLLDEAPRRVRNSQARAVPAGSLLFGFKLSTGVAYCAAIPHGGPVARVQCLRDLDADGRFDAGYVTRDTGLKSRVLPAFLHGLQAAPKLRYEAVEPEAAPPMAAEVRFAGFRGSTPLFRVHVEGEPLDHPTACEARSDGVCDVLGLTLQVKPLPNGGARIDTLTSRSPRIIEIEIDAEL